MEGVDFSDARPDLAKLKSAGIGFVVRYLSVVNSATQPKILTADEAGRIFAAGLGLVLNWEYTAGAMHGGYTVGVAHGKEALAQANALGAPADIPIYFSCDFDAQSSDLANIAGYLKGVRESLPLERIGLYGGIRVIDFMIPEYATWGWQTIAWSHGAVSDKAHLYQYAVDSSVAGQSNLDRDRSLKSSFGMWSADMTPEEFLNMRVPGTETPNYGDGKLGRQMWEVLSDLYHMRSEIYGERPVDPSMAKVLNPTLTLTDVQIADFASRLSAETNTEVIASTLREVLQQATWKAS